MTPATVAVRAGEATAKAAAVDAIAGIFRQIDDARLARRQLKEELAAFDRDPVRSKSFVADVERRNILDDIAESEAEGFGFLTRLRDRWLDGTNRFDQPGEALFMGSEPHHPVAIGGLNRDPYVADDRRGRVRHLFVSASHRRMGVGRTMVQHIIEHASEHFSAVGLRTPDKDASAFYEALGFTRVDEADTTHLLVLQVHANRAQPKTCRDDNTLRDPPDGECVEQT